MRALTDPALAPAMAGALLAALRAKGVTPEEVRGFASAMRALARKPVLPAGAPALDVVGTGGDASGSFNLSTGAALLVAVAGRARRQARQPLGVEPLGQRRPARSARSAAAARRDARRAIVSRRPDSRSSSRRTITRR